MHNIRAIALQFASSHSFNALLSHLESSYYIERLIGMIEKSAITAPSEKPAPGHLKRIANPDAEMHPWGIPDSARAFIRPVLFIGQPRAGEPVSANHSGDDK